MHSNGRIFACTILMCRLRSLPLLKHASHCGHAYARPAFPGRVEDGRTECDEDIMYCTAGMADVPALLVFGAELDERADA